ncbi:hypothetical protein LRD69_00945 [Streptomyces sp. JH14]|uniref:hypothetical protein n=1 Tax=Streptomyces sp. JH14 TaxID=2793630 RepID=UPI0023F8779A|nr:hypothetical protein [Streptomyces sp. JH14]MDF6040757.1 hypothetical protein [Streptomyces sp. JH14]
MTAAAMTVRLSRAVSTLRATKGPGGAVTQAPRAPAGRPEPPLVLTVSTMTTTAPPSEVRARVAAMT